MHDDAHKPRIMCSYTYFVYTPEIMCKIARDPTIARHSEWTTALAHDPSLATAIGRDPLLITELYRKPHWASALLSKCEWATALVRNPASAAAVALNSDLAAALSRDDELASALARDPEWAAEFARNPKWADEFVRNDKLAKALDRGEVELAATLIQDNDLAAAYARDPVLAKALACNPEWAAALASNQTWALALVRDSELIAALTRDPDLASKLAHCSDLAAALASNSEVAAAFARDPALAIALVRDPEIASTFARMASSLFLFGADSANRCIKLLHTGTGALIEAYKTDSVTHCVHNAFLPDLSKKEDLLAIDSIPVSRLIGVFIRNETVFHVLRLSFEYAGNKSTDTWHVIWKEEFYRVEKEQLEAEDSHTSLCRAGNYIICAVSGAYRLTAFEYTGSKNPLKAEGEQRFDEKIVQVAATNSTNGSLIAIAFADDTIRLYLQKSSQRSKMRFDLQETFQVVCENVHQLLFTGERLLVTERSEDEEEDRIWSCQVIGEGLNVEGIVQLDEPTSIESWCYDSIGNHIYCVNALANESLNLG